MKKRYDLILANDIRIKSLLDMNLLRVDSENGLVFSTKAGKRAPGPIGSPNKHGYLRTTVSTKGVAISVMIHRVVWIHAHGVPPLAMEVNHKDGRKLNNAIDNLELVTCLENNEHARATGLWTPCFGEDNGQAKITDEQVCTARRMNLEGASSSEIANVLGVTQSYARRIVQGKTRNFSPT